MTGRTICVAVLGALLAGGVSASWYWPFGSDGDEEKDEPRLSELMEPASLAIDEATDLISDGKTDEAVEKYREALRVLEQLEVKYPERAATPEFQSVRNKRAYVDAQLNAILLEEARVNAKAVAVTDTTDLEEKLRKKRADEAAKKKAAADAAKAGLAKDVQPKLESQLDDYMDDARARAKKIGRAAAAVKFERESEERIAELLKDDPKSRKARIMRAGLELYRKNYGSARKDVEAILEKDPDDVSALNLLAAVAAATGNFDEAEEALVKAIRVDENDYHAYYNLAKLLYKRSKGKDLERTKRFYQDGRKSKEKGGPGGPEDPFLEKVTRNREGDSE